MMQVHDARQCALGEGLLWHPLRQQLFWFDITGNRLLSRDGTELLDWQFDENVSAAGWISHSELLIATETALLQFDIDSGESRFLCALEADKPQTRSNDGRADRQGGFWIGTMGKHAETGAGAIYRWYRGELRRLFSNISIPNAICFAPSGDQAYYADTARGKVMRVALDSDGWPLGKPSLYLDCGAEGLNPDGAVIDAEGNMWLAQWGAGRVACYDPEGRYLRNVAMDSPHSTCPAFGGADLRMLFCTTATQGLSVEALARHPQAGQLFCAADVAPGLPEPQVLL